MKFDDKASKDHPLIEEFVNLVCDTVGDGVLEFSNLETPPFLKFWPHLIIYKYENDIDDFRVVFYGTHVVKMYGAEWTGKLLSEMGFAEAYDEVRELNMKALNGDHRVYSSGNLFWQNKEHRKWYQIKMPLQRHGDINEVLVCMDISDEKIE